METFQVIIHAIVNLNDSVKDSTSEEIIYVNLQLQEFFYILQPRISQVSPEKQSNRIYVQIYKRRFIIGTGSQNYGNEVTGVIPGFPEAETLMSKAGEGGFHSSKRKRFYPSSTFYFYLGSQWIGRCPTRIDEGCLLYSIY